MSIISNSNNNDNYIFMVMVMIIMVALVLIVPLASPLESATAYSSMIAALSSEEIVVNPISWTEFRGWMIENPTMYWSYDETTRNCVWFTNDLVVTAKADGIVVYPVTIYRSGYDNHAINYGEFWDKDGKTVFGLIEPKTGEIWFSISDYLQSEDGMGIISITVKNGVLEENAKSIKRLY